MVAASVAAAEAPKPAEDLKPRFDELAKQSRAHAVERKKLSEERANFAKERTEYEEWKKSREDFRRNPSKLLSKELGENWYDTLTNVKLNGAPTADLIVSELDDREAKLRKDFEAREQKLRDEIGSREKSEAARAKADYEASAVEYAKSNAEKFPLINEFKEWDAVPREIERHYVETCKRNDAGELEPGEVWTAEEAAKAIEERIAGIEKKFIERYEKLKAAKAPGSPNQKRTEPPQRRTLSTEMTASTGGEWTPPKDDSERMRRAIAVAENSMAARQQH